MTKVDINDVTQIGIELCPSSLQAILWQLFSATYLIKFGKMFSKNQILFCFVCLSGVKNTPGFNKLAKIIDFGIIR